jgi:hypothetical protein
MNERMASLQSSVRLQMSSRSPQTLKSPIATNSRRHLRSWKILPFDFWFIGLNSGLSWIVSNKLLSFKFMSFYLWLYACPAKADRGQFGEFIGLSFLSSISRRFWRREGSKAHLGSQRWFKGCLLALARFLELENVSGLLQKCRNFHLGLCFLLWVLSHDWSKGMSSCWLNLQKVGSWISYC